MKKEHFSSAGSVQDEITLENMDVPPDCHYCNQAFNEKSKQVYDSHIIQKHSGKPGYPGSADIQFYKLTPKGMVC